MAGSDNANGTVSEVKQSQGDVFDEAAAAPVTWLAGDVPVSSRFEDAYFAYSDGLAETREVFIGGNDLIARWTDGVGYRIGELGFGTGLNFLATLDAWHQWLQSNEGLTVAAPYLSYRAFELYPMDWADMARVFARWPELAKYASELGTVWQSSGPLANAPSGSDTPSGQTLRIKTSGWQLEVIFGDARQTVAHWPEPVDAWYLDGFSPAKNPELWELELLEAVFARTPPGGTFSTYTASGFVRRNLVAAGFEVQRVKGFGQKRERLQGVRSAVSKPHQ